MCSGYYEAKHTSLVLELPFKITVCTFIPYSIILCNCKQNIFLLDATWVNTRDDAFLFPIDSMCVYLGVGRCQYIFILSLSPFPSDCTSLLHLRTGGVNLCASPHVDHHILSICLFVHLFVP